MTTFGMAFYQSNVSTVHTHPVAYVAETEAARRPPAFEEELLCRASWCTTILQDAACQMFCSVYERLPLRTVARQLLHGLIKTEPCIGLMKYSTVNG
jgi:hypothetical protein